METHGISVVNGTAQDLKYTCQQQAGVIVTSTNLVYCQNSMFLVSFLLWKASCLNCSLV